MLSPKIFMWLKQPPERIKMPILFGFFSDNQHKYAVESQEIHFIYIKCFSACRANETVLAFFIFFFLERKEKNYVQANAACMTYDVS